MRNLNELPEKASNTAFTLQLRLTLRDITPFGRNVVYAGNVRRHICAQKGRKLI